MFSLFLEILTELFIFPILSLDLYIQYKSFRKKKKKIFLLINNEKNI